MKLYDYCARAIFLLIFGLIIDGCNSKNGKTSEPKTDSVATGTTDTLSTKDVDTSEKTALPVYAIWVSKKRDNRSYDGLYDSASGYIRLCESKQVYHVDDPKEISINADNKCFSQGLHAEMVTIKRDSGMPLFLTVLDVDSSHGYLVGLTDKNDTIMTSVANMNHEAFEKLKKEYTVSPLKDADKDKIRELYLPEARIRNFEKKERIMKRTQ